MDNKLRDITQFISKIVRQYLCRRLLVLSDILYYIQKEINYILIFEKLTFDLLSYVILTTCQYSPHRLSDKILLFILTNFDTNLEKIFLAIVSHIHNAFGMLALL